MRMAPAVRIFYLRRSRYESVDERYKLFAICIISF